METCATCASDAHLVTAAVGFCELRAQRKTSDFFENARYYFIAIWMVLRFTATENDRVVRVQAAIARQSG